ncbi:MAG: flagellar biosynthesis protein FlhF [Bacteroidetes bacterium]|nr:flagellar biosynthesis protein FlhF [Bacteroidota bacterium]
MQIKKYVAESLKEATEQMKQELGPEAIILHTRKLPKNSLLKTIGKERVEITAAIDELPHPLNDEKSLTKFQPTYSKHAVRHSYDKAMKEAIANNESKPEDVIESLRKMTEAFEERETEKTPMKALPQQVKDAGEIVQLKSDVEDMKSMLTTLSRQLQYKSFGQLPDSVKDIYLTLLQQDVEEKYVLDITSEIEKKLSRSRKDSPVSADTLVLQLLAEKFPVQQSSAKTAKRKIIALVGPTGVGKTTTIAKLAAIEKLVNNKSVALITCDTYRIGAIEQLKTFASIADIPMQVVYRSSELPAALKKINRADVVLIDTVGRSHRAKKELLELKKMVEAAHATEVHLVTGSQSNTATLQSIVKEYKILEPTHLILSKLDEAVTFGPLYNIMQKTKLPVSFFTLGQSVPDDICAANGTKFAAMLYQGILAHA